MIHLARNVLHLTSYIDSSLYFSIVAHERERNPIALLLIATQYISCLSYHVITENIWRNLIDGIRQADGIELTCVDMLHVYIGPIPYQYWHLFRPNDWANVVLVMSYVQTKRLGECLPRWWHLLGWKYWVKMVSRCWHIIDRMYEPKLFPWWHLTSLKYEDNIVLFAEVQTFIKQTHRFKWLLLY